MKMNRVVPQTKRGNW